MNSSQDGRNKACDVLIAFDESLYDHHDGNMTYLANLAKDHLKVQQIYILTVYSNKFEMFIYTLSYVVSQALVKSYWIGQLNLKMTHKF